MNYFLDASNLLVNRAKKYFTKDIIRNFDRLGSYINTTKFINSTDQYNSAIQKIIVLVKDSISSIKDFPLYEIEIVEISKGAPLTEKTPWGGVALKRVDVDRDYIRKFLVIGQYGILGFEIHKQKLERLKILEGVCIVLYSNHRSRNWKQGKITVKLGAPGDNFEFLPNDEHGIIALTNCVIEEKSTNHLDDLIYIFKTS